MSNQFPCKECLIKIICVNTCEHATFKKVPRNVINNACQYCGTEFKEDDVWCHGCNEHNRMTNYYYAPYIPLTIHKMKSDEDVN